MLPGYHIEWSGQFEYLQRAVVKLKIVIPSTLLVILVLLLLNCGRLTETLIVMPSAPFALVGGAWLMWWLGYNICVAVAVGFIALAGVAAKTGVFMLIYLDQALVEISEQRHLEGQALSRADLRRAIMAGLVPILWSTGTGSEVMCRIAVPMVGDMASSTILTLLVIPTIYAIVKGWRLPSESRDVAGEDAAMLPAPASAE